MKAVRCAFVVACGLATGCQAPQSERIEPLNPYEYQLADGEYGVERLPFGESWPDFAIGWQRREELIDATQRSMN